VSGTRLRVGMGDRYGISLTVPRNADFDPSAVTGAVMKVTKPGGTADAVSWTAAITAQDADSATIRYAFSSTGLDLDVPGTWKAWIQWTEPGFTIGPRSEVAPFPVDPTNTI
jgi:hypothetical protein